MRDKPNYVGIDKDIFAGMAPSGTIIRDAWVFGIIPVSEPCAGCTIQGMEAPYHKVSPAWEPYGHLASNLPPDLRQGHQRIYEAAVQHAKAPGWNPELDDEDN